MLKPVARQWRPTALCVVGGSEAWGRELVMLTQALPVLALEPQLEAELRLMRSASMCVCVCMCVRVCARACDRGTEREMLAV